MTIHVRMLSPIDATAYFHMVDRSRDGLYMFPWVVEFTLQRADTFLAEKTSNDGQNKAFIYGIFLDSLLIGCIEVRDNNLQIDGHELGYFMDAQNRGRGRMKEALQIVMKQHYDIFPFYADVLEDNAPSLWLLWGLGFKEDHRWKRDEGQPVLVRLVYNKHIK